MRKDIVRSIGFACALLASAAAAGAQPFPAVDVSALVSATNVNARTSLTLAGAVTFRLTPVVGLEVEASVAPHLAGAYRAPGLDEGPWRGPAGLGSGIPGSGGQVLLVVPSLARLDHARGRLIVLSNNVRISIPTTGTRLEPYVVAGGGIARTSHSGVLTLDLGPIIPVDGLEFPIPAAISQPFRQASTDLALTLGGGLSIRVSRTVAVDGDLRLIRLMGGTSRSAGRFGVGMRVRF